MMTKNRSRQKLDLTKPARALESRLALDGVRRVVARVVRSDCFRGLFCTVLARNVMFPFSFSTAVRLSASSLR